MIEWKEFDDPAATERNLLRELAEPPPRAGVHFKLAKLYLYTRDLPKAIRHCQKALEIDPAKHPLYWEFLTHAHQRAGNYWKAVEYLYQLTRLPDPESQHYIDLYELLLQIGATDEAKGAFNRMRRIFPSTITEALREQGLLKDRPHFRLN